MSLLSSYSSANLVNQTSVCIRYSVAYVEDDEANYYRVTRTATRRYAYVGMTHAAAIQCAATKLAQYTRTYYSLASSVASGATVPAIVTRTASGASVSTSKGSGESWNVNISVSESDVRASSTAPTDLDALFSTENARNYDDPFQGYSLTLTATSSGGTVSSTIPDFDASGCVIEAKQSEQASWESIKVTWGSSPNENSFTYEGTYAYLRARFGDYDSNTVSVS